MPKLSRAQSVKLSKSAIKQAMSDESQAGSIPVSSAGSLSPRTYEQGGVRLSLISEQPSVLRVFHMSEERLYADVEQKELLSNDALKSFKAIRATSQTPARVITNAVGKKLFVPDVSLFKLYKIGKGHVTMLRDDERPVVLMKNEDNLKFAVLHTPAAKQEVKKTTKKKGTGTWTPEPGDLAHRRLMNDSFSKFADLVLLVEGAHVYCFQAFMELRCPGVLAAEALIKKQKEKKAVHGKIITLELQPGKVSLTTLQHTLDYAYTGKLDFQSFSEQRLMDIMGLANQWGMDELALSCEACLKNNLGLHNIFPFLKQASAAGLDDLHQFGIDFCLRNWTTVAGNKEGLTIIGLEKFQELTLANAKNAGANLPEPEPMEVPESTLPQALRQLRQQMHFSDGVAVFGQSIIPFHRWVLVAASSKFEEKFASTTQKSSKVVPQYTFEGITERAFGGLLDLLYFGDTDVGIDEACELIEHVVIPYELVSIREYCEKKIADTKLLATDNVLRVLNITYLPMSQGNLTLTVTLRSECLNFIVANFSEVNLEIIDSMPHQVSTDLLHLMHKKFLEHEILGLG